MQAVFDMSDEITEAQVQVKLAEQCGCLRWCGLCTHQWVTLAEPQPVLGGVSIPSLFSGLIS